MNTFNDKSDYYAQLEVESDCTQEEIKSSFKRLALQLHPDKNLDKDTTETFKLVGPTTTWIHYEAGGL
jgi:curved DNA-binding protein CbpA